MLQEDEARALGEAPEVEMEPEQTNVEEDDDGSSDELFGFGFGQKKQGTAKAKPKARTASSRPSDSRAVAETPLTTETTSAPVALTSKLDKAKDLLDVFSRFSPLALWQGSQKEKDCEVKMKKAMEVCDALANDPAADDHSKKLAEKLESESLQISQVMQLLSLFKQIIEDIKPTGNAERLETDESTANMMCDLPQDCITAMLTQLGRSLCEVGNIQFKVIQITFLC